MKVILRENVKSLGTAGSVVSVADGYARNFLIPKNLAVEASTKSIKALEHEKRKIAEQTRKLKNSAGELSGRLGGLALTIAAKAGSEEKLFGSITTMDITEALRKEGFDIDRKKVLLEEPIRRLGTYTVGVRIHPEVTAEFTLHVVAE